MNCTCARSSTAITTASAIFPDLLQKLDYLQDLGVTCLWLLPFFPSPLKDDGYDISDYLNVHPMYGTMEDFQAFLRCGARTGTAGDDRAGDESHLRPASLVSTRPPGAARDRRNAITTSGATPIRSTRDARIIFTDTEKSNWTWDPVAQAYFWHRFFSHQPDLNFDNPKVVEEMLNVMRLLAGPGRGRAAAWTPSHTWWSAKGPAARTFPRRTC